MRTEAGGFCEALRGILPSRISIQATSGRGNNCETFFGRSQQKQTTTAAFCEFYDISRIKMHLKAPTRKAQRKKEFYAFRQNMRNFLSGAFLGRWFWVIVGVTCLMFLRLLIDLPNSPLPAHGFLSIHFPPSARFTLETFSC